MKIKILRETVTPDYEDSSGYNSGETNWQGKIVDALKFDTGYLFIYNSKFGFSRQVFKDDAEEIPEKTPGPHEEIHAAIIRDGQSAQTCNFTEIFGQKIKHIEFHI